MQRLKTKLLSTAAALVLASPFAVANNDCCFGGFTVGADFLYWTPCISNNHYAVEFDTDIVSDLEIGTVDAKAKYKFLDCDWEPGYRAYVGINDVFGCFDLMLTYTHFDAESSGSIRRSPGSNRILLSYPDPVIQDIGDSARAHWDLQYRHYEATIGYPVEFGKSSCFEVTPFSGLQLVTMNQKRHERLSETVSEGPSDLQEIHRKVDYWGMGSMLGLAYSYKIFDCLSWNGRFGGQIVIGQAEAKDKFRFVGDVQILQEEGEELRLVDVEADYETRFKSKDECFCFPGWHLRSGLSYNVCLCGWEVNAKLGYEYIQWIDAPTFLSYETEGLGIMSSVNRSSLTMYGFFAGLDVSF